MKAASKLRLMYLQTVSARRRYRGPISTPGAPQRSFSRPKWPESAVKCPRSSYEDRYCATYARHKPELGCLALKKEQLAVARHDGCRSYRERLGCLALQSEQFVVTRRRRCRSRLHMYREQSFRSPLKRSSRYHCRLRSHRGVQLVVIHPRQSV
jgi:hypothetical protein